MYYLFLLILIYITTLKLSNTLLALNYNGFLDNSSKKNIGNIILNTLSVEIKSTVKMNMQNLIKRLTKKMCF